MIDGQRRPSEAPLTSDELDDLIPYVPDEVSPLLAVTEADIQAALRQQTDELISRLDSGAEPLNISCGSCGGPMW